MNALQKYQQRLMELLDSHISPSEIRRQLIEDLDCSVYRNYIESFDNRMIEIGKELTQKWAQRSELPHSDQFNDGDHLCK